MPAAQNHFDVIIVGAGLSGVGAAYHLQTRCPEKSFVILEGRERIGGTWDLFRYPGIRSDSDMYTLGYRFRPWRKPKAIADGPSIREYVNDTAAHYGIGDHIRFTHSVTSASWSSKDACWTVTATHDGAPVQFTCGFLWMCSGYYRYDQGYTPDFPGADQFSGRIVHPQHWPEDLDYQDKKIVVIGSGATAVTLIPSMADKAAHITMLQRSPTYMFSMPADSPLASFLKRILPESVVYRLIRWQRILLQQFAFKMARRFPQGTRRNLIKMTKERLPEGYEVGKHFAPTYNPWDQRICVVPDDDLFEAIGDGRASVVTDKVKTFTPKGIMLESGNELEADIIITATGLNVQIVGGAELAVDGKPVNLGDTFTYKGLMLSDVPNFASVFGYTNASWTLRADLVSDYVCRLMNYMDENGFVEAAPHNADPAMKREPFLDFSSGYVMRAVDSLPKQGDRAPWRQPQDYATDFFRLKYSKLDDGVMRFRKASSEAVQSLETKPVPAAAE